MTKRKKTFAQVLFMLGMALLGGLIGYFLGKYLLPASNQGPSLPLYFKLALIPLFPLAIFLVIAVHELGHVMAGLAMRFQFSMLTIGPLMWQKDGPRLRFNWNTNLNTFGGLALCLPRDAQHLIRRFLVFAAGGPLASLLLAVLGLGSYYALEAAWGRSDNLGIYLLTFLCFLTGLISLFIFVVTMIPMRSGGFYSDGGRILNLWRGGYAAQIDTALLTAYAHLVSGMRPKTISPLLLLEALELPQESPFKGYLHNLLHYHYLDKGDMEMAAHHLEKYETYLQHIPEGYQASFWLDKAFFLAFVARDAEAAQQAFDQARLNPAIAKSVVYRVEAALALVHQNWEQAHYKAELALKELAKSIDKGSALAQKEWVEAIKVQAREAQNQHLTLNEDATLE